MNIAVAAFASCNFGVAGSQRFPVNAGVVGLLLVSMAGGAGWLGEIGLVRKTFDAGMAIHAGEHGTMNGCLECVPMNCLAVHHRGIAVTSEAIIAGELGRGRGRGSCIGIPGTGKQQAEDTEQF